MHTVDLIKDDETGEFILPLTDKIFEGLGWEVGDKILWTDNGDGSWTMSKKPKTKIVMVETVSSFRMRYAVEIPTDAPNDWALDTVTMNEAKELSQVHIGENIVNHREISQMEFLHTFHADNDYLKSWTDDQCFDSGLTRWGEKVEL